MQTGLGNKNIPTGETRAFKHSVNSVKRDTLLNKRDFFLRLLTAIFGPLFRDKHRLSSHKDAENFVHLIFTLVPLTSLQLLNRLTKKKKAKVHWHARGLDLTVGTQEGRRRTLASRFLITNGSLLSPYNYHRAETGPFIEYSRGVQHN